MDMLEFERKYWKLNFKHLAGIDEAGRGPLAGPVIASAVIFPKEIDLPEVTDSKKLTEKKRERLFGDICNKALSIGVGIVHEEEIDKKNILQATYEAMRIAIRKLSLEPDLLLIDGNKVDIEKYKQKNIIKGDQKSLSIAAASIIAKVTRDRMMTQYDIIFPGYGFSRHKGYGTKQHIEAINNKKSTLIHRKSFNPVFKFLPDFAFLKQNHLIDTLGNQLVACQYIREGYEIQAFGDKEKKLNDISIVIKKQQEMIFIIVNTFLDYNSFKHKFYKNKMNNNKLLNNINNYIECNNLSCHIDLIFAKVLLSKNKPIIKLNHMEYFKFEKY